MQTDHINVGVKGAAMFGTQLLLMPTNFSLKSRMLPETV